MEAEVASLMASRSSSLTLEEQDLTLRKLTEYQTHIRTVQKEKGSKEEARSLTNPKGSHLWKMMLLLLPKHRYIALSQTHLSKADFDSIL
ncbi:hypothetical protein YC2023_116162 [Brassica napus]